MKKKKLKKKATLNGEYEIYLEKYKNIVFDK